MIKGNSVGFNNLVMPLKVTAPLISESMAHACINGLLNAEITETISSGGSVSIPFKHGGYADVGSSRIHLAKANLVINRAVAQPDLSQWVAGRYAYMIAQGYDVIGLGCMMRQYPNARLVDYNETTQVTTVDFSSRTSSFDMRSDSFNLHASGELNVNYPCAEAAVTLNSALDKAGRFIVGWQTFGIEGELAGSTFKFRRKPAVNLLTQDPIISDGPGVISLYNDELLEAGISGVCSAVGSTFSRTALILDSIQDLGPMDPVALLPRIELAANFDARGIGIGMFTLIVNSYRPVALTAASWKMSFHLQGPASYGEWPMIFTMLFGVITDDTVTDPIGVTAPPVQQAETTAD